MTSISIIIPCYNCESDIVESIEAILRGTFLPMEIVLIDDSSTDNTLKILELLSTKHHSLVRFSKTDQNSGPARTRNVGAKLARGDYLFFLDSDTRLLPDALANFSASIDQYDAIVGMYDEEPINPGASPFYKAMLYTYLLGQKGVHTYDQFSASCAGIRSDVYWKLGGYDENFSPGLDFENEEFGHRISVQHRMVLDPRIRARHRFPGFWKMTSTFFHRTALWVEMFMLRRKFSSSGGTKITGLSSLALLASAALLPLTTLHPLGFLPSITAYLIYLYGYIGFYRFVIKQRRSFLPAAIILNHYYTLVVACGAIYGVAKIVKGDSRIFQNYSYLRKKTK